MGAREELAAIRGRLRRESDGDGLGLTLLSAAIAALLVSPVAWLFLRVADIPTAEALSLVTRQSMVDVVLSSGLLVVAVTVGSVLLGVPLAFLTVRTDLPARRFFTVILALPLVVPSYIGAFAFVSAFGPRGVVADALAPLGIERLPETPGLPGAAIVLTLYIYPYVFLTTRAALLSLDASHVEAARTLGKSRLAAFREVTFPRIVPGIAAGALLVALYALSDFGTPAIMGADVFTAQIYVEYNNFGENRAALLSLELLAITTVILALESRVGRDDASAYASGGGGSATRIRLGAWRWLAALGCLAVAALALVLPVGILLLWLVRGGPGYAGGGFEFELAYALNSVGVSTAAALASVLLALPVGYVAARRSSAAGRLAERATYVGYAMPGVVLGLALVFFGVKFAPTLYQTLPLLVFAYVVRFLPQAVGTTSSSVLQVDQQLVEAARALGESPRRAFRRVTLPLIWPGVLAGAALVFLTTMKELPATLILRPTGFETLVSYIWLVQGAGYYGRAAIPALTLIAVSACSMAVILAQERR
ncbi:ABC transporter permease [Haloglomus litoreum]|uniref:ABC transporter permease n=1 Tax=Haloglomus litoreum TaxID=3034026 RepID=UPI0023E8B42F|nr:iron ABC transporter permease [Haloglomus sp. DT116]